MIKWFVMVEFFVGFILCDVIGGGDGCVIFWVDFENGDLFDVLYGCLV